MKRRGPVGAAVAVAIAAMCALAACGSATEAQPAPSRSASFASVPPSSPAASAAPQPTPPAAPTTEPQSTAVAAPQPPSKPPPATKASSPAPQATPPPPPPAVTQTSRDFGASGQGRPLTVTHRIADGPRLPTIFVVGAIHGDEPAGARIVDRLLGLALPAGADVWLAPTLNPDGSAARTRGNAAGVDLNRNFPDLWAPTEPGTATYGGPSAASEVETRAFMALLDEIDPAVVIVLHQPLNGVDTYRMKSPALVRRLAAQTGLPAREFACGGVCRGTFTGWFNTTHAGAAVTVELPRSPSNAQLDRVARGILTASYG
jgi:protein MpaA